MSRSALASLARPAAPGALRLSELARLFAEADEVSAEIAARRLRRETLFRESPKQALRRALLGLAYAARHGRARGVVSTCRVVLRDALRRVRELPEAHLALNTPDGLCGLAADLSVRTLLSAYARGLYPWSHTGPVKWWAPRTRCVADPRGIPVCKAARRHAKRGTLRFTFDRDFDAVIAACASPRGGRLPLTWITPKIMWAYAALHDAGLAHSYEVWNEAGELVAGGYGVPVGRVFVGESMFTRAPGAGAYGFAALNRHLAEWGFALHDVKMPSAHFRELGFVQMPREDYARYLSGALPACCPGPWHSVPALAALR